MDFPWLSVITFVPLAGALVVGLGRMGQSIGAVWDARLAGEAGR